MFKDVLNKIEKEMFKNTYKCGNCKYFKKNYIGNYGLCMNRLDEGFLREVKSNECCMLCEIRKYK